MSDAGQVNVTFLGTPEQGRELLESLAEDDELRAEVEDNPAEVLRRFGVEVSGALPDKAQLAPKEEIKRLLGEMDRQAPILGEVAPAALGFQILAIVFRFAALPFVERENARHGAR